MAVVGELWVVWVGMSVLRKLCVVLVSEVSKSAATSWTWVASLSTVFPEDEIANLAISSTRSNGGVIKGPIIIPRQPSVMLACPAASRACATASLTCLKWLAWERKPSGEI